MQNLVHRLGASSSTPQDPVIEIEQIASIRTHSEAISTPRKSKWISLGKLPLQELRGHFRRPNMFRKEAPDARESFIAIMTLSHSKSNLLLILVPFSWISHFLGFNSVLVFFLSFFAIIPLPKFHSFATNELSKRMGSLDGLIDVTLGNAVELVVTVNSYPSRIFPPPTRRPDPGTPAFDRLYSCVTCGSHPWLPVPTLGMSFLAGGIRFSEQSFGMSPRPVMVVAGVAQVNTSLLTLSVTSVLLPTVFYKAIRSRAIDGVNNLTNQQEAHDILAISHGQFSHKNIWGDNDTDIQKSVEYTPRLARKLYIKMKKGTVDRPVSGTTSNLPPSGIGESDQDPTVRDLQDIEVGSVGEHEKPQMCLSIIIVLLVVTTGLITMTSDALVKSIDGLAIMVKTSNEFVSLIVLPLLGNIEGESYPPRLSADHQISFHSLIWLVPHTEIKAAVTIIAASSKDQATMALAVTMSSSILSLSSCRVRLLFPSQPTLDFLLVNYVAQDGKSNWLEGMILFCIYIIFAVALWFYPGSDPGSVIASWQSVNAQTQESTMPVWWGERERSGRGRGITTLST
ncbi:calcium/proton exchanger [Lactarius psammicola]|nr:calcium/proton exchanger [Lactarius psammicola]